MIIAFQIIVLIALFVSLVLVTSRKTEKELRVTSWYVYLTSILTFITSVMFL